MLLEHEPVEDFKICDGCEFVTAGQFHCFKDIEMLRKLIGQVNRDQIWQCNFPEFIASCNSFHYLIYNVFFSCRTFWRKQILFRVSH